MRSAVVALHLIDRDLMTALLIGGAGILYLRDKEAAVSGIADGTFDALVLAYAMSL